MISRGDGDTVSIVHRLFSFGFPNTAQPAIPYPPFISFLRFPSFVYFLWMIPFKPICCFNV